MIEQKPEYRARTVAFWGLGFQVLLSVVFVLLFLWSGSESMWGLTRLGVIGITIWLFLVLLYHQRALVREESLETEQLRKEREGGAGTGAIFDVESEEFLLARRRLRWMYKWVLPVFTILIITELLVAAFAFWAWDLGFSVESEKWPEVTHINLLALFVGGLALLCFLFSRYATGMAREPEWRMLRAGASFLMGITLAAVAVCIPLGFMCYVETQVPERVLAYVIRIIPIVLAVEFSLNFILDFYRPRAADEEPRPAFDSRLLGLFCEPGGIARSIAEAINYQFGFEVSSTWFYKLLQRSVVPLIGFAALTLFGASCMVFVEAHEQAVIEQFGQKLRPVLQPGIHFKYPWPVDKAYKVATARVLELKIGITEEEVKTSSHKGELILWTNKHSKEPHLNVLVATPQLAEYITGSDAVKKPRAEGLGNDAAVKPAEGSFVKLSQAVAVSQLRVSATIQYRIRDAYQWLTTYDDPEAMLAAVAEREITQYCASIEIEDLLGRQRGQIEEALGEIIRRKANADNANLGVDILFFALQGVHPPVETAEAFQEVIGSEQKKTAAIRSADIDFNKRLTEAAGAVGQAKLLAEAIAEMNELEQAKDASDEKRQKYQVAVDRVNALFFGDYDKGINPIGGEASRLVAEAGAARWRMVNQRHGWAQQFVQEIAIKNTAPKVYRVRKYHEALADSVAKVRKYVLAAEGVAKIFQINLQDATSAPLDVTMEGEE